MRIATISLALGLLAAGAAAAQVKTDVLPPATSAATAGPAKSIPPRDLSSALARITRLQAENDALRQQLGQALGKDGEAPVRRVSGAVASAGPEPLDDCPE